MSWAEVVPMSQHEVVSLNKNKMEALKKKWDAEIMMLNEYYTCAKDKLMEAQQLYPDLDNIDAMLIVCDILLFVACIKLSDSEIDDNWVLELLAPSITNSDASFRYQNLLNLLQPIRDEFPGAELAFQFLQNACSRLLDGERNFEYSFKHESSVAGYKSKCRNASSSQMGTGCKKDVSTTIISGKSRNIESYLLPYCDTSRQDGLRNNQPAQSKNNIIRVPLTVSLQKSNQEFYDFEHNRKVELLRAGEIWAAKFQTNSPWNYRYALINSNDNFELSVTWLKPVPVSPSEKRWYLAGLPVACGSFELSPQTNDVVWPMIFSYKCSPVYSAIEAQFEIFPQKGEIWALYKNWDPECAYNFESLKGCKFDFVEMLSDFSKFSGAKVVCLMKVDGFRSVFQRQTIGQYPIICEIPSNNLYMFSHNIPAYRLMGGDSDKVVNTIFELDQLALPVDMVHMVDSQIIINKEKTNSSSGFTPLEQLPYLESYGESKFLKLIWSPNDFAVGQVWGVYHGKDMMPRCYVQIENVISKKQVSVTFLEPYPVLRRDNEWKKKNLPIACGVFELCKTSVILEMSQFSHSIEHQSSLTEPYFIIYPKKGEVWAMYKNWNNEWNHNDYRTCQYFVVEILSELPDENGMRIAKLVEVENNLTFFHRQQYDGFDNIRTVSQTEMFSFSHQIPAFKVPGVGTFGIPEDSWHLDPNALPL